MSILTDLILSLESHAKLPAHLSASQVSSLCNLASKHLFLFNPSTFIIPKSQQSYLSTESILTLFQTNLLQSRTNLLSIDLPIYFKLIQALSSTLLSHLTPTFLSAQLQSISLPLSPILLNIILNRVTPHCSFQQFSTFLQYLQAKLQHSPTNQITIEQIDEWKYYPEYSKSLNNVNDLMDLIGVLKMGEFERRILTEKLEGLSLGGSNLNGVGNSSGDERNVYQQQEELNTLPTESSIEQSIDCYYFSQIQKLEQQIQLNQNERNKFILKIKELEQKQEIYQNRIKYLIQQNEQILKEIKRVKEEKVRIEQEMEITEFTWLQEKSNIQSKIRSAEALNVTLKLNITELENFIANLQEKLRSEQEISSLAGSNSKNIFDSLYGYNKKRSIAGEAVTLANEIREILGAEGEGQGEGERRLRKWSATLDKFNFKKEQLEEEERQDSLLGEVENKKDIRGKVLMFNSMCEEKEISRDAMRDAKMQRTVFKVQFLTKTTAIDGYINLGTDNLIFQDFSHTTLKLIDYCHLTSIQIYYNLLVLTICSFDYLILSFQLPFLSQLLSQKSPISSFCISNDISHKTVVTPQGLVSLTSIPQTILNSNKIFLRDARWEGKMILIEKKLFRKSRRECYIILKGDGSVLVFENGTMKQIIKWGMVNGVIVKVDQKVEMMWKEGEWGLELEMQEGKELAREVQKIRNEITEDMERKYGSMRKYEQK